MELALPSKSRSQQRLMGAAEHGANFPMARKLRASMTQQQLRDFASGSEAGKPEHVTAAASRRTMHPAMRQRSQMVKEAHAHLAQAIPGFHGLPKSQRMIAVQHHVNLRLGRVR